MEFEVPKTTLFPPTGRVGRKPCHGPVILLTTTIANAPVPDNGCTKIKKEISLDFPAKRPTT